MPKLSTLTKADIVTKVHERMGGPKKEISAIVETIFDAIKEVLAKGEKLKISRFGNFVVRDKRDRMGRNPQTGLKLKISARRVLSFKPSQLLKAAMNR